MVCLDLSMRISLPVSKFCSNFLQYISTAGSSTTTPTRMQSRSCRISSLASRRELVSSLMTTASPSQILRAYGTRKLSGKLPLCLFFPTWHPLPFYLVGALDPFDLRQRAMNEGTDIVQHHGPRYGLPAQRPGTLKGRVRETLPVREPQLSFHWRDATSWVPNEHR